MEEKSEKSELDSMLEEATQSANIIGDVTAAIEASQKILSDAGVDSIIIVQKGKCYAASKHLSGIKKAKEGNDTQALLDYTGMLAANKFTDVAGQAMEMLGSVSSTKESSDKAKKAFMTLGYALEIAEELLND